MMNFSGKNLLSNHKRPTSISRRIVFIVAFTVLFLFSVYILFFFFFGLELSLKLDKIQYAEEFYDCALIFFRKGDFNFSHFLEVFTSFGDIGTDTSYPIMILNSLWRTLLGTTINWFCTAMVCYVLVHYKNKMTKFIYNFGLVITMVPLYGAGAAEFRLFSSMGLINNPLIYITQITLYGANFFYMYAFWKSISWEYAEAGLIDGETHLGVFFKIMFPMLVPSAISLFVMLFVANWNDYSYTLLYMNNYPDLAYGIYAFQEVTKYGGSDMPLLFSGVILSMIPIFILFVCFQNTIMEKVYLGGLKG